MTATLLGSPAPLSSAFDAALVDLDGVAYRGPHAIPTAPPALAAARAAGMGVVFVTNNANRTPEQVAAHLTELGIDAAADEVLTAAQAAAVLLAERVPTGSPVLVVGGPGLRSAVSEQGFTLVDSADDAPAAVVQGFAPGVGWEQLAEAAYAVRSGAYYLASNLDKTLPNERGLAPGNGSLVQVVVTASGVQPDSAGKPEPAMFHLAARRAGASRPLVVGDRLDTDLAGARSAGYPGLMVLTGVNDLRDALLAPPAHRPSFIGADLSCLAEAHPAPLLAEGWWAVGTARARVRDDDGGLEVEGPEGLDRGRAACVAAWAAADAGAPVAVESFRLDGLS